MAEHVEQKASFSALDNELVPLSVAANVTYFHLTEVGKQVLTHENLAEILPVVAVALSQVSPIYRAPADGATPPRLTEQEIEALLFRPVRDGEPPSLDGFSIRRGDLRMALVTLREARNLFGRRDEV